MRRGGALFGVIGCLAVAACGGAPNWTKAGSDAAATERDYRDCLGLAGDAVRTDTDIDQDIAATRASDLQRSTVVRAQSQDVHQTNSERGTAIVAACMKTKGFVPAGGK